MKPVFDRRPSTAMVRDIVPVALQPEDRDARSGLNFAQRLDWDPRKEIRTYADLDRFRALSGRLAARRPGPAMGPEGLREAADLRL